MGIWVNNNQALECTREKKLVKVTEKRGKSRMTTGETTFVVIYLLRFTWLIICAKTSVVFCVVLFQGTVSALLTTTQLHKRAERVAQMAVEQGRLSSGDNVALLFTPGMF